MSWQVDGFIFYEGEDVEALKSEYVRLAALYKNRPSPYEIARYVFRNCKNTELRAPQAGQLWAQDLAVQERIRLAILNGGTEVKPAGDSLTEAEWKLKILATTENDNLGSQDKKAQLDGLRLLGEAYGWITKDKKLNLGVGVEGGLAETFEKLAKLLPN